MTGSPGELELVARVAVAAGLGVLLGAEREFSAKAAGMRTHALVVAGSAAFTLAGYGAVGIAGATRPDVSRIAAQVASGIGFLGAGVIIVQRDRIRGVTTAAEVWANAAIGVLCGLGLLLVATITTAILLTVVAGLRPVERRMVRYRREHRVDGDDDEGRTAGQARGRGARSRHLRGVRAARGPDGP